MTREDREYYRPTMNMLDRCGFDSSKVSTDTLKLINALYYFEIFPFELYLKGDVDNEVFNEFIHINSKTKERFSKILEQINQDVNNDSRRIFQ